MNTNQTRRYQELLPPLWILALLGTALLVFLAIQIKELLVLLVLGYSIAFVIEPAVSFFEKTGFGKYKLGRSGAFFLIIAIGCLIILTLVLTASPTISREYNRLVTELPNYVADA